MDRPGLEVVHRKDQAEGTRRKEEPLHTLLDKGQVHTKSSHGVRVKTCC